MAKKRKTKEQKIISELRRKLAIQSSSSEQVLRQAPTKLPQQSQMEAPNPAVKKGGFANFLPLESKITSGLPTSTPEKSTLVSAQNNYSYLLKDLKKATILIGLAIFAQGVLYWALR